MGAAPDHRASPQASKPLKQPNDTVAASGHRVCFPVAELDATGLGSGQGGLGALADQTSCQFGQTPSHCWSTKDHA